MGGGGGRTLLSRILAALKHTNTMLGACECWIRNNLKEIDSTQTTGIPHLRGESTGNKGGGGEL